MDELEARSHLPEGVPGGVECKVLDGSGTRAIVQNAERVLERSTLTALHQIRARLRSPTLGERLAGLAELERLGAEGVPTLCELLLDPHDADGFSAEDYRVRTEAAAALGRLADPYAVEALARVAFFNNAVSPDIPFIRYRKRSFGAALLLQVVWVIAGGSTGFVLADYGLLLLFAPTLGYLAVLLLARCISGLPLGPRPIGLEETAVEALARIAEQNQARELGWLAPELRTASLDTLVRSPRPGTRRAYQDAARRIEALANLPLPAESPAAEQATLPRPSHPEPPAS